DLLQVSRQAGHTPGGEAVAEFLRRRLNGLGHRRSERGGGPRRAPRRRDREQAGGPLPEIGPTHAVDGGAGAPQRLRQRGLALAWGGLEDDGGVAEDGGRVVVAPQSLQGATLRDAEGVPSHVPTPSVASCSNGGGA